MVAQEKLSVGRILDTASLLSDLHDTGTATDVGVFLPGINLAIADPAIVAGVDDGLVGFDGYLHVYHGHIVTVQHQVA